MADLNYKFTGVNSEQLANEVQHLRKNSSTFRALEGAAAAAGYNTIEIQMGARVLRNNMADSIQTDPSTRKIRINSDVTGSWGVGGRQATVGEVIAHELAHAVIPPEFSERGVYDFTERGVEGMWVRRQAGQVARDLGLPGPNNADHLITKIPVNEFKAAPSSGLEAMAPGMVSSFSTARGDTMELVRAVRPLRVPKTRSTRVGLQPMKWNKTD